MVQEGKVISSTHYFLLAPKPGDRHSVPPLASVRPFDPRADNPKTDDLKANTHHSGKSTFFVGKIIFCYMFFSVVVPYMHFSAIFSNLWCKIVIVRRAFFQGKQLPISSNLIYFMHAQQLILKHNTLAWHNFMKLHAFQLFRS